MSEESKTPTIYPSFNARNLSAEQVAKTFVPSDHFRELCGQNHTLIVGPRGSGKTTLLKMVQKQALDAWNHPVADETRNTIGFTGVYVPTDVSWHAQISGLVEQSVPDGVGQIFQIAAFTTHILRSLVISMEYRTRELSTKKEIGNQSSVVYRICDAWNLTPRVSTFRALKYAMSQRLTDLHVLASSVELMSSDQAKHIAATTSWLHLSFVSCCSAAIEVFDDNFGEQSDRWALLLDELELAPNSVTAHLLQSLRSVDQKLLFKLSLVPFSKDMIKFGDALKAPSSGNDFSFIKLWYAHKDESEKFCKQLWYATLNELGIKKADPEELLGDSYFSTGSEEWAESGTAYRSNSKIWKRFNRLAEKDSTFVDYLKKKNCWPLKFDKIKGKRRAQILRKVTSIVALRDALIRSQKGDGSFEMRSVKNPNLYSGADSIFAVTEGNPRWFKGLVGGLVADGHVEGKIKLAKQNARVKTTTSKFRALLRTIPGPQHATNKRVKRGMLEVVDLIGRYFYESQVTSEFNPDPVGSFTVDSRADDDLLDALVRALNAGAIVLMPDAEESVQMISSLRGKRFRLSYMLAPYFLILLRAGRSISLRKVLDNRNDPLPLFGEEQYE